MLEDEVDELEEEVFSLLLLEQLPIRAMATKIPTAARQPILKYESGASAPSRKLRELAQLYHVSTDYILGEEDALAEKLREADERTSSHLRKYLV